MSDELIQNVYQTLISCSDKRPIVFTPGVGYNLSVADYSDLTQYEPVLATEVPTVENGRLIVNSSGSYWRFTINTNAQFQPWVDHLGVTQPARNVTAADVVYSFRRQVVYDSIYSPDWMWMTPAFGYQSWRSAYGGPFTTYTNYTFKNPVDEWSAGNLIGNWTYAVGSDVHFYFQKPWAEGILKQIFSQTWGSVVNPDWVREMGGWDGLFTIGVSSSDMSAGWSNNYHGKPTNTRSELDTYKSPATFPGHGSKYSTYTPRMCGTGPYTLTSWDTVQKIWRIDRFPAYWLGWGDAGDKAGNYLSSVTWKSVDSWSTRKMLFLEGEFDIAVVPRANMYDLLQAGSSYNPLPCINLVYNVPSLTNDVMLFSFSISDASPNQAYVGYPTHTGGAQAYFFNNTHMRRAFAWALNYTQYIQDAWSGEAIVQNTWWVDGLSPPSYKNTNSSMPQRNLNYAEMQNEFNQAIVGGQNVSQVGFEITLAYYAGNDQRMIVCNLIKSAFSTLNAKYHVNVVGYDPFYLRTHASYLPLDPGDFYEPGPMYDVGWLADFADPDNFCEPYQVSWGAFMSCQIDQSVNAQPGDQAFVDSEITNALIEPNSTTRRTMYQDLQYRYWLDVPSFPLIQPVGRRWARDWVQGWYFNALMPGANVFDLYKALVSSDTVDIDATDTITPGPGPIYGTALIFNGAMYVGYQNGAMHYLEPQGMNYTVSVNYTSGSVANLLVAVGLKRNSSQPIYGETQYPCVDQIIMSPGQTYSTVFWWHEDGTTQRVSADNAQEDYPPLPPTGHSGTIYDVGLEAYPVNGQDINTANNYALYGQWNASRLVADIRSDGIVNILDAIKLSNAYGAISYSSNWNVNADLNADGVISVLDAIILSNNFGKHVP
jgi:peptide/nickel transport system substrate-binding protein